MPAEEPRGEAAGELLKAAREARGLAIEQVADALHLEEAVIVALEESRFDGLGAPVFIRGHLRAYARLVELPEEQVLAAVPDEPSPTPPARKRPRGVEVASLNSLYWMLGLCGVLLAAGLAWYVLSDSDDRVAADHVVPTLTTPLANLPGGEMPATAQAAAAANTGKTAVPPAAVVGEPPVSEPAVASPVPASPPQPLRTDAGPAAAVEAGSNEVVLVLKFGADSWAEVADRNRRLLFGLQPAGTRRELRGVPPFSLLLGNAPAVEIEVEGEPWPLPPRRGNGRVARLTIEPAGASR